MFIRTTTERPTVFAICLANGQIVDARQTPGHETLAGVVAFI
jgi:hypothetical protein